MRRCLSLLTIALLAGCAPHGTAPGHDPGVNYLEGVETEYSYRLENVPGSEVLGPDTSLQNGLIAGDGELYVAAALFESQGFVTMDLIVLNHTEHELRLERDDLRLVDQKGRWLSPVDDWQGAELVGLRGKTRSRQAPAWTEAPSSFDSPMSSKSLIEPEAMAAEMGNRQKTRADGVSPARPRGEAGYWEPSVDPAKDASPAPAALVIDGNAGRTWWAYWQANEISYPLTAFVMLDGRHLVFRFQR